MITVLTRSSFIFSLIVWLLMGKQAVAQHTQLDRYINEALEKSPLVHQDSMDLTRAKLARHIARSHYIPTADFQLGYQTSMGGRSIDLPVGDMLNGVYSALNQLTGTSSFPHIENEKVNFFPQNFYDAKIRTTVPLYNPEIRPSVNLSQNQINSSVLNLTMQKRDLVKQVKQAYYAYLLASRASEIYEDALLLAKEGKRVNERLLANGKGLPAYVLRAEAEMESIQAELYKSKAQQMNAQALFNFLLSKQQDDPIDTSFDEVAALNECYSLAASAIQVDEREEIKTLKNASLMYENVLNMSKSAAKPRLNGILDLGSQASDWKFNNESRYFLLALQLDIPLFNASRIRKKVEQSRLDILKNESRIGWVQQQLSLTARSAVSDLQSALQSIKAREKQVEAAGAYKRLIDKGYAEGVSTFIETMDARTQWMQSQISLKIQIYQTLAAAANAERELALYPLN